MQGRTAVCDVIGHEHALTNKISEMGGIADEHRFRQCLAHIGVVLDVHMPDVLQVECVGDPSRNEETAPDYAEHSVRDPVIVNQLLRKPSDANAEILVCEDLKLGLSRQIRCHAQSQT